MQTLIFLNNANSLVTVPTEGIVLVANDTGNVLINGSLTKASPYADQAAAVAAIDAINVLINNVDLTSF